MLVSMHYIWQISALDLDEITFLSGTVLRGNIKDKPYATTLVGHIFKVIKSYFKKTYRNRNITVNFNDLTATTTTNSKGYFSFLINGRMNDSFSLIDAKGQELAMPGHYPIHFRETNANIEVISDIDDTIFLSNTISFIKRVKTILLNLPNKRRAIDFTYKLFKLFEQHNFRITYLSKSESNLFGLITEIIKFHELPKGALILTPYLKFRQLFKPKKGKNYKIDHLKILFKGMPNKYFILFGDDSQKDMEAYTQIAKEFAGKILKIYIRQTGFNQNDQQRAQWRKLIATGVQAVYFTDDLSVEEEIIEVKNYINPYL